MSIENPGVVLPVILAVLLLGMAICLYVIIRFFRRLGQKDQPSSRQATPAKPARPGRASRVRDWLAEPVAAEPKGKPAQPSPTGRAAGPPPPEAVPGPATGVWPEPLPVPAPATGDAFEVLRVLRVGTLGELVVEVEGQRYRRLVEIRDGVVGRRVLLAIQELGEFTGPLGQRPLPELHRQPPPDEQTAAAEPPITEEQAAFLATLQTPEEAEKEPEAPPRIDLVGYWRRGLSPSRRREAREEAEEPAGTFVSQIEGMLQERLAGHPVWKGRAIHFISSPTGELQIEVDGGLYEAVNDVPYLDVRQFLKETIRDWERG